MRLRVCVYAFVSSFGRKATRTPWVRGTGGGAVAVRDVVVHGARGHREHGVPVGDVEATHNSG